jgi:hypothetical protein
MLKTRYLEGVNRIAPTPKHIVDFAPIGQHKRCVLSPLFHEQN